MLSILLLCFSLTSCEKSDLLEQEQIEKSISANGEEGDPTGSNTGIVEVVEILPWKKNLLTGAIGLPVAPSNN